MKRFNILVLATLLMTCSTASFGEDENSEPSFQRGEGMKRGEGGGMILSLINNPRMAKKLKLTDDQQVALEKVAEDFKQQRRTMQEKMEGTMVQQAELLTAETVDEVAVMAAIDEAFDRRRDMAKLQMKVLLEARKILTPEQIKDLQAMREEFKKKHGDHSDWKKNRSDQPTPTNEPAITPAE